MFNESCLIVRPVSDLLWMPSRVLSVTAIVRLRMCNDDGVGLLASAGEAVADLCSLQFLRRCLRVGDSANMCCRVIFFPSFCLLFSFPLYFLLINCVCSVVPVVLSLLGDPSSGGISAGLPTDVAILFSKEFSSACARSSWRLFWSSNTEISKHDNVFFSSS